MKRQLDRVRVRHPDGRWFTLGYRDGELRAIYERVVHDAGPAAGGPSFYDRPFWHINSSNGKLSKRAAALLEELKPYE